MRQTISGLVAAIAVVAAGAVPAMACGGGGLFQVRARLADRAMSARARRVTSRPRSIRAATAGCGWAYERLPDPVREYSTAVPVHQYYYADQGPTYTGPGDFAPYPIYREGGCRAIATTTIIMATATPIAIATATRPIAAMRRVSTRRTIAACATAPRWACRGPTAITRCTNARCAATTDPALY